MTAVKPPPYAPGTDREWARSIMSRLRQLESTDTVRAGEWVLSTDEKGTLTASKPGAGTLTLAGGPDNLTADPGDSNGNYVTPAQVTKAITGDSGDLKDLGEWLEAQWLKYITPDSDLAAQWNDAKAKWDTLLAQLSSYPPLGSSAATVATWWSTLFVNLGNDPMFSANLANIISGNYDLAKQAKDWLDQFLDGLGLTNGTEAANTITTQLGWWARLPENILISLDQAHWFYPLGSPTDGPLTTVNGKRTFYAAKADMALMQGQTNNTATPAITIGQDLGTFATDTQTRVVSNEDTLSKVQAKVDALVADDTSVAGKKYVVPASGGSAASWGSPWTVTPTNSSIAPKSVLDIYAMTLAASSTIDLKLSGVYANTTLTDQQIVTAVFYDAAQPMAGGIGPRNTFKGRMSADGQNYVYVRVDYNKVSLGYAVGGVEKTPWAVVNGVTVPAGALVELYLGSSSGDRNYLVRVNGTTVISYAESGTDSMFGANYRGGGQDMSASHGAFNDTFSPARIRQFSLRDSNVAAVTYGTSGRWYRSVTSAFATTKGQTNGLGKVALNTIDYSSADLVLYNGGVGIFTPGRYLMSFSARFDAVLSTGMTADLVRVTSGGSNIIETGVNYATASMVGLEGHFEFNAIGDGTATELWYPAVDLAGSGSGPGIIGDGIGFKTWMTLTRIS